jgi:hypothetical protein
MLTAATYHFEGVGTGQREQIVLESLFHDINEVLYILGGRQEHCHQLWGREGAAAGGRGALLLLFHQLAYDVWRACAGPLQQLDQLAAIETELTGHQFDQIGQFVPLPSCLDRPADQVVGVVPAHLQYILSLQAWFYIYRSSERRIILLIVFGIIAL